MENEQKAPPGFEIIQYPTIREVGRLDYLQALSSGHTLCPITPLPVRQANVIGINQTRTFTPTPNPSLPGFYYRTPIGSSLTTDGQKISKYDPLFQKPYFGFPYPVGSQYDGLILVKSFNSLSIVPNDVVLITAAEVATELSYFVHSLYDI